MKKVYVVCFNHMDEIWRRCFRDHFCYEGNVIRPYSEIEEALFNQWIKTIEKAGCKYSIEQCMTIREYLERNPDKFNRFKQLVHDGSIEILGGGETIIDYNMVQGESIVRSHLYSILWYMENMGRRPETGIATDTFGLSAQLPQIYRKLRYDSLILYSRVFDKCKPFWKGLDGELIYIKQDYSDEGILKIEEADYQKYPVCSSCSGEGCKCCGYTGVDYSYRRYSFEKNLQAAFERMRDSLENEFILIFSSEEVLENDGFKTDIEKYAEEHGIQIDYSTFGEITEKFGSRYLEALKSGSVVDSDIDGRIEANPVSTGCYVSRIELKKLNRRLEDMLTSCEKFALFASTMGMNYPKMKMRRLWNMMALVQFHDSITSTHIDAGYEELMRTIRTIGIGASQIYSEAMETIEKSIGIPKKEGYEAFVLFNPLNWKISGNIFETVLSVEKDRKISGVTIEDSRGNVQEILGITFVENRANNSVNVRFKGAEVPPMGYAVFYFKLSGEAPNPTEKTDNCIENEYYRITLGDHGVTEIYDKELKEKVLSGGVGDLIVEDDFGSVWETQAEPLFREVLSKPYNVDNITKSKFNTSVKVRQSGSEKTARIEGSYTNPGRTINKVDWSQEISLFKGIKKIYFRTHIDWDAYNHRIMVRLPLNFKTANDEAYYEIPYGTLKRKAYKGQYGKHSTGNGDWPAINFAACFNAEKNYTVALINKGLPANQVKDGIMYLSLLRSPIMPVYIYDNGGAKDEGSHTFEYMITTDKGGLREGQFVQKGMEFNTEFMTCPGFQKEGSLGPEHSFLKNFSDNIIISAVKKPEKGDGIVIRAYEAYGDTVEDSFDGFNLENAQETNLLEEGGIKVAGLSFKPFEIKTLKLE